MSSRLSSHTTLWLCTGAVVALFGAYITLENRKAHKKRDTVQDIQHNFYATGSDIVKVYGDAIPRKTFVITGTTSGLGRQTALLLGHNGAHVVMGIRRPQDGSDLIKEIERQGGTTQAFALDLSSLKSTKEFTSQVFDALNKRGNKLDVLTNNAGVFGAKGRTEDGYQTVWQVNSNSMAPALLTELLLPIMTDDARIVNVSSEMHKFCFGGIASKCPPTSAGVGSSDYALSKACQIVHACELTLRFAKESSQKRAMAIEPGLVPTNIGRHFPQFILWLEYKLLGPFFLRTVDQGCSSTIFCALAQPKDLGDDDVTNPLLDNHCYYVNCAPKKPTSRCNSAEEAAALAELFTGIWQGYLK
jgi:WW domain-containing oxidoreductase